MYELYTLTMSYYMDHNYLVLNMIQNITQMCKLLYFMLEFVLFNELIQKNIYLTIISYVRLYRVKKAINVNLYHLLLTQV